MTKENIPAEEADLSKKVNLPDKANSPEKANLPDKESAVFNTAAELGGVELLNARYKKQNFSRHSHEGFTLGVIQEGAQCFYRTGGNHIAPQDSIILVNADEVHNGHSAADGGWAYKAMYPLPEQLNSVCAELGSFKDVTPYFPEPVVHDPELAAQFRQLFEVLETSDNRLLRESLMYAFLVKLIHRHGRSRLPEGPQTKVQSQLHRVKEFLDDFPEADISLEDLAQLANLSPYHLIRAFGKAFGLPPHAYQVQARLRLARQFLRKGQTLADAAQSSGFHDQSHLHRHFKKAMGVTPKQYRQSFGF